MFFSTPIRALEIIAAFALWSLGDCKNDSTSEYSGIASYDYTTDDSRGLSGPQTAGVVLGTLTGVVALVGGVLKCYTINKIEELQKSTRQAERELAERARDRMERGEAGGDYTIGVDGSANALQNLSQPDGSQGASAGGGGGGA